MRMIISLNRPISATETAGEFGVDVQILYANNDAITQSTQLLRAIQVDEPDRPNAIVFEPVGRTAFPQIAQTAIRAGIGWAVLNRDAAYVAEFGRNRRVPISGSARTRWRWGK